MSHINLNVFWTVTSEYTFAFITDQHDNRVVYSTFEVQVASIRSVLLK